MRSTGTERKRRVLDGVLAEVDELATIAGG